MFPFQPKTLLEVATPFFLLSLLLLFSMPRPLYAKTTLKVGVYDNKPIEFTDKDGRVRGIFIDILEDIAQKEDWHFEYVHGHWREVFKWVQNGTIDLLPAIAHSAEREKKLRRNCAATPVLCKLQVMPWPCWTKREFTF